MTASRCGLCDGEGFIYVGAVLQPCPQCLGTGRAGEGGDEPGDDDGLD